ncbi:MAG: PAS domain S-box protein [Verrucomicrobia bacterium]|nr:PAS domain S-box protein [Verrucomicrobiota bacterium]
MKLSTETKVYAFFFAAFAGVVILGFVTYRSTRELIVNDRLVVHTDQVRQSIADLLGAVLEAENRRRDYLLTADARFLEQFLANLDRIPTVTRKIIDLTADNPDQQTRIAELKSLTEQSLSIWAATADAARAARQAGGQIPPLAREIELRSCIAELTTLLDKMNASEDEVLRTRSDAASKSGARTISVVLLGGGFSTLVVLLAIAILRRDLAEKRQASEALRRQEAELREAQRVASVGSWEWIMESGAFTWSEELYHIAGREPREAPPDFQELPTLLTPQSWIQLEPALDRAMKTGLAQQLDLEIIRPDGTTRWIAARGEAVRETTGQITKIRGTAQDITERKRAAEEIQDLYDHAPCGYDSIDENGRFVRVNETELSWLGYTQAELVGKMKFQDLLTEESKRIFDQNFPRAKAEGRLKDLEIEMVRKDGTILQVLLSSMVVKDKNSDSFITRTTLYDVTERKRVAEELRLFSERLTLATRAASIGIWDWDLRTNQVYWDEKMFEIYSLPRLDPMPYERWLQTIYPEDLARVIEFRRTIVANKSHGALDFRIARQNGSLRYIQGAECVVLNGKQEAIRVLGVNIDVTERKKTEHKIQEQANLLGLASDAIIVRGLDEEIQYWNKSAERLYGWTAEEAIGADFREIAAEDPAPFEAAKGILLEKGEWSGEVRITTKLGTNVIVASRWTLLLDDLRKPRSILAIDTDITEKKQMEALFLRNQRLESIGQLAGGIAHDLNNILAPILMGAQMLRANANDPESPFILATIETNAQRGAEIVKQVVAFARGVDGKRVLLQVRYVLAEICGIIRETFPRSIVLKTEEQQNLWTIMGDATQLHQVLLNLAVNARDAMPYGGTLTLAAENLILDETVASLRPGLKPGPHVLFTISDTGTGIAPEIADKIFDPFFTNKGPDKGSGLGLSTVLGIVKNHKGHVEFDSKVGEGTTFRVYFPAEPDLPRVAPIKQGPCSASAPKGRGQLILIVDDEEAVRSVTKRILESHGYRTVIATQGAQAVACYLERGYEISVVLTDLHMPDMDGVEAISVLRQINPSVKIIVVTGAGSALGAPTAEEMGVQAYIKKPFDVAHLLGTLHNVIQARTLQ